MIVGYINGQDLQLRYSKIVSDTVDYLTADFCFMTGEWNGFDKYVHFANGETHYKIKLTNDKVLKTDHLNLTQGSWSVYLHGVLKSEVITTNKCDLIVEATGDISGGEDTGSAIQEAIKQAQEEYRSDLETSLETATGENYDGKTWEELNDTVAELPIISEEQTQALGDWDLIKEYFADLDTITHDLFRLTPKDETGQTRRYSLPYLYTPKFRWNTTNKISNFIDEVGVDVTGSTAIGNENRATAFNDLQSLKSLILTGNKDKPSLIWSFWRDKSLEYIKFETPSEEVLKTNPRYYVSAFYLCERLETIDCELDFTGQTSLENMFQECYKIQNIRIKPHTLSTSLHLGHSTVLHTTGSGDYESLISILNGITLDKEVAKNITLTFSSAITDITQGMVHFWNCNVYATDSGLYYAEPPKDEVYLEVSLYEAFMARGVTIKWQ